MATAAKKTSKKAAKKTSTKTAPPAVVENNNLPSISDMGAFGTEDIDHEDLIIPKILVMQGLSQRVTEGKAALGDLVDSLTGEILGNEKEGFEFIPFKTFKTWICFEDEEYKETVPVNAQNADWPIEEIVDGITIRRDKVYNVMCLLPHQIEEGEFLPYVLAFRRTSYYTGRKLATAFAKMKKFNKPACSKVWKLTSNRQQKDKHTFFTFDVEITRPTEDKYIMECFEWFTVAQGKKIDDSDLKKETDGIDSGESFQV